MNEKRKAVRSISQSQAALIMRKLTTSTLLPTQQEAVICKLLELDYEQAEAILKSLDQLNEKENSYSEATQEWLRSWQQIAAQLEVRLEAEAKKIEEQLVRELLPRK